MARQMTITLDGGDKFIIPVKEPDENRLVLKTDHEGFCRVEGTDGQVLVMHRTRIGYVHVKPEE